MFRFRYSKINGSYNAALRGDHIKNLIVKLDSGASKSAIGLGCFLSPDWFDKSEQEKNEVEQFLIEYYNNQGNDIEYVGSLHFILLLCVDSTCVLLGNDFTHYCRLVKNYKDDYVVESMNLSEYHDLRAIDDNVNLTEEIEEILSDNFSYI